MKYVHGFSVRTILVLVGFVFVISFPATGCKVWKKINSVDDISGAETKYDRDRKREKFKAAAEAEGRAAAEKAKKENAAIAARYVQPYGSFDGVIGWTRVDAEKTRRVYAASKLVAPSGVTGAWHEELTLASAEPTFSELTESVTVNTIACLGTTSALSSGVPTGRVIYKDANGAVLAIANYSDSKYFDRGKNRLVYLVDKKAQTIASQRGRPENWIGQNGGFNFRATVFIDSTAVKTALLFPIATLPGTEHLYHRGPSTGTLTADLASVNTTARTAVEITANPTLEGLVDGRMIQRVQQLSSGEYNTTVTTIPEVGVNRFNTTEDPFDAVDPDNANVRAVTFIQSDGHIRPKGTTFSRLTLYPATLLLFTEENVAGKEAVVIGTLNTGSLVNVTLDIPKANFKGFDENTIEVKRAGPSATIENSLVIIPKARGETTVDFTSPVHLGENLEVVTMQVIVRDPITKLILDPPQATVVQGGSIPYTLTQVSTKGDSEASFRGVVLTLNDPAGGVLNRDTGALTGVQTRGTYTVTATAENGTTVQATYTVDLEVTAVAIAPVNTTAVVGSTVKFVSTLTYSDKSTADASSRVTLEVSDPKKAKVLSPSEVEILAAGSFTVTAKVFTSGAPVVSPPATVVGVTLAAQ